MSKNLKQKKSVVILNMGTIGDILMSTPIPKALKDDNDNTHVSWIIQPQFCGLLDGNPYIDEIICWDYASFINNLKKKRFFHAIRSLKKLKKQLKAFQFDTALDLQGELTSGLISWLSGATHRIALGSEETGNLFVTKTITRTIGDQIQLGSEYRYLITQLGISDKDWKMSIPSNPKIKALAEALIRPHVGNDAYAVICPFSNREAKLWSNPNWQQIALRVRGRYHLRTVILGGENEVDKGYEISRLSGAINLAGQTSLLEAAEIIRGAKFVVGVDTGLTHMAHAVGTPTLSLFGPTYPYAYAGEDTSNVIHTDRYCSPCDNHVICKRQYHCMQGITPDRVLTEIKPIMLANQGIIKAQNI